ncbi:acetyl-CoA carboxylase carboxyltransferase subunit alpha [soil metagenome]|jgi:acetyl-CoA carboxylase carboxyl transferase subunit alpha|nr:acetyl-CoA carboxylase carboxyltransferase subunit alpha [Acidobacteriota bacterium]
MKEEKKTSDAFERVQTARHPERPYTMDLLGTIFKDFVEIHGDRRYADDAAMVCGFAKLDDFEVAVIGQQKGRDTNQRRFRNFGMPKPEGYRKALRVMKMAEKFGRPLITLIDTPGAYPGIDAEERGQAEAIAFNLREMANLKVPIIAVILGEGGSGGALAIGIGDRVLMMENAVYSVITPEGCAAILWKDAEQAGRAAEVLRLTAKNLKQFGLIDEIVPEHTDWKFNSDENSELQKSYKKTAENLKEILLRNLKQLDVLDGKERLELRFQKFRKMGSWIS